MRASMGVGRKVDALHERQTPPAVTDELSARLLDALGPAALIELTAKVAFMNMSARMNVALGIHADGFADACELPPLEQRATTATATSIQTTDAAASALGSAS